MSSGAESKRRRCPRSRARTSRVTPSLASQLAPVASGVEGEGQALERLAARAPVAVRARDVAEEGERRALVEGGGVDAQVLAEERAAQRARRPRVPERGVQLGVGGEGAARPVGRA